jgi:hypothetical protein
VRGGTYNGCESVTFHHVTRAVLDVDRADCADEVAALNIKVVWLSWPAVNARGYVTTALPLSPLLERRAQLLKCCLCACLLLRTHCSGVP